VSLGMLVRPLAAAAGDMPNEICHHPLSSRGGVGANEVGLVVAGIRYCRRTREIAAARVEDDEKEEGPSSYGSFARPPRTHTQAFLAARER